jgi:predicted transcriptional regulator
MRYTWGYAPPLILEAAVRNHVFDALEQGPKTVAEVSASTGASERGLSSIMNALVGLELLVREDTGRYELTPESAAYLVSDKPAYLGGMLAHSSTQLIP